MGSEHDSQLLKGVLSLLLLHSALRAGVVRIRARPAPARGGVERDPRRHGLPGPARLSEKVASARGLSRRTPAQPCKYYRPTPSRPGRDALTAGTADWMSLAAVVGAQLARPLPAAAPRKEPDMQHTVTWFDRLRIERVIWTVLHQRLDHLPRARPNPHRDPPGGASEPPHRRPRCRHHPGRYATSAAAPSSRRRSSRPRSDRSPVTPPSAAASPQTHRSLPRPLVLRRRSERLRQRDQRR